MFIDRYWKNKCQCAHYSSSKKEDIYSINPDGQQTLGILSAFFKDCNATVYYFYYGDDLVSCDAWMPHVLFSLKQSIFFFSTFCNVILYNIYFLCIKCIYVSLINLRCIIFN